MAKKCVKVQILDSNLAVLVHESVTYKIKMESKLKNKLKNIAFGCIALALIGIIYFGYFCPDQICALSSDSRGHDELTLFQRAYPLEDNLGKPLTYLMNPSIGGGLSYDDVIKDNFQFDMNGHDVMVFLHIQKTGGTSFGKHLVRDLDLLRPCNCQRKRKRCHCFRPNRNESWLFSRYTTGWKCGLHADWTELSACVDIQMDKKEKEKVKRRYFYITLLRHPITRYISEFRHVQRGATWQSSRHWCGGRKPTPDELPLCYSGMSWKGVTLDEFIACPYNLATNRQTRMIADLALVGCYNMSYMKKEERDRVLLASAKRNLAAMAFFGLTEHQRVSQYIFEETFNLRFSVPFEQHNATHSSPFMLKLQKDQLETIQRLNALDIELYTFAEGLMYQRFNKLKYRDSLFEERFTHLGDLQYQPENNLSLDTTGPSLNSDTN